MASPPTAAPEAIPPGALPRTNAEMEALNAQQKALFKRNDSANKLTANIREQCTQRRVVRKSMPEIFDIQPRPRLDATEPATPANP